MARDVALQGAFEETVREGLMLQNHIEEAEFERGEARSAQKRQAQNLMANALQDKQFCRDVADGKLSAVRQWRRWNWIVHQAREIEG